LPKLPTVTGAQAVRALEKAGFVVRRQRGSHVVLSHPVRRLRVSVSLHAGEDLPPGTLRSIIRSAGLSVEEFTRLLK